MGQPARAAAPELAQDYAVVIVSPEGYAHADAFLEIAQTVHQGLAELGYSARIRRNEPDPSARNIILGASLLTQDQIAALPPDTILYNFEQLADGSGWFTDVNKRLFSRFQIWDYSPRNIDFLRGQSLRVPPLHVPLGFADTLARIPPAREQDIDVLFYGCMNDRRRKIIADLQTAGLNVVKLFKVYGAERDAHIARAKVVLNMHFFETQIFEIARVSYLLSNQKAVVTEAGPQTQIDPALRRGMACAPYDGLVQTCVDLVRDAPRRHALEQAGHAAFSARPQSEILKTALIQEMSTAMQTAEKLYQIEDIPKVLNIGSGKDFRDDCLNLDISDQWDPDIVADLSNRDLMEAAFHTDRFAQVQFGKGMFNKIICNDVVEHIPDLVSAMTNCLDLLEDGGTMEILVPYDLSFGAWQDPTHVRAFNERSWLYYTDWFWYIGWAEARFHTRKLDFNLSAIGQTLLKGGMAQDVLLRAPRAVDSMFVVLEKQPLSDQEKRVLASATGR